MKKILTVVICTYNRAKYLELALRSLVDQTVSSDFFDVLIVDNNSSDNTEEIFKKYESRLSLFYVLEKNQGLSYARNTGIKETSTQYIAFLDDDAQADKNWVKFVLDTINNVNPIIFGGPIYPYYESEKPDWFLDKYEIRKISEKAVFINKDGYLSGSNMIFKMEAFSKIGLFDVERGMKGNKVSVGEETKLQIIAKEKNIEIYYNPDIFVEHLVPQYKMKLTYFIKRACIASYEQRFIFGNRKYNLLKDVLNFIKGIILTFVSLVLFLFRDTKKYPFWQNYFIEKMLNNVSLVGVLYFYMKIKK